MWVEANPSPHCRKQLGQFVRGTKRWCSRQLNRTRTPVRLCWHLGSGWRNRSLSGKQCLYFAHIRDAWIGLRFCCDLRCKQVSTVTIIPARGRGTPQAFVVQGCSVALFFLECTSFVSCLLTPCILRGRESDMGNEVAPSLSLSGIATLRSVQLLDYRRWFARLDVGPFFVVYAAIFYEMIHLSLLEHW